MYLYEIHKLNRIRDKPNHRGITNRHIKIAIFIELKCCWMKPCQISLIFYYDKVDDAMWLHTINC